MDDIGNLIYVLLFVIWVLYRIFGPGKKQIQKPLPPIDETASVPGNGDSRRQPVTFEDILRELTGAPAPAAETKSQEPEIIYREPEPEGTYDLEEYETTGVATSSISPAPAFPELKSKKIEVVETPGRKGGVQAAREVRKMLRSKNGLRKAIILKEILDKPYHKSWQQY